MPPLPRFARALDLLAVIALLLTATVYITGGFREWMPFGRLSITTWIRPLLVAAAALALRHWWWPRPWIGLRLTRGAAAWWRRTDTRTVVPIVLTTRTGVFVVGFLAIVLFGYRPNVPVPWRYHENEVANLPARWDAGWYIGVAIDGYAWDRRYADREQNIAFFPLYPMLMRYGSLLFAREVMWTGVLISWVSFFLALVYLFRLARAQLGSDDHAATGLALLACYPFALYFSTAYTESLFLLTIVAACYHFERDELWKAAAWGLAAGLTRPNGSLLSVALALMAIRPLWPHGWAAWRPTLPPPGGWARVADRIAVAAMPGIGMLIFSTFIYNLTGNPLQWTVQNAAWGRVYRGLDYLVAQQAEMIGQQGLYTYSSSRPLDALQLSAVIFVLLSVWPVLRRLGLPYAVLILVNIVPPLLMGGLLSIGRVTSVLFPTFIWLGAAIPAAHRTAWIAGFAMLQAICAALFFTWRPLF